MKQKILYNPGDKVKIKSDLRSMYESDHNHMYYGIYRREGNIFYITLEKETIKYAGMTVTIDSLNYEGFYRIKEDNGKWLWSFEMFEKIYDDKNCFFCSLI